MQDKIKAVGILVIVAVLAIGPNYLAYRSKLRHEAKLAIVQEERMNVACPTLLSVARTPRDTLLVMRSEDICITYVMKTLK
jgi:hypothetical protein